MPNKLKFFVTLFIHYQFLRYIINYYVFGIPNTACLASSCVNPYHKNIRKQKRDMRCSLFWTSMVKGNFVNSRDSSFLSFLSQSRLPGPGTININSIQAYRLMKYKKKKKYQTYCIKHKLTCTSMSVFNSSWIKISRAINILTRYGIFINFIQSNFTYRQKMFQNISLF